MAPGLESEATLSASRTAAREAVRRLDQVGLLEIGPNRRARKLSAAEGVETYEVRALLAGRVAGCAAQRASKDDVIAEVAGNEVVTETTQLVTNRITDLEIVTRDTRSSIISAHQHAAIVRAIEARDPEAAEAAMRTHVDTNQGVAKERTAQPNGESR